MNQANLSGTENIRLTGTRLYPKNRLDNLIKVVLLNSHNYRFMAPAFLALLSLAIMPREISVSGIDYFRMLLAWIVILLVPGYLLLPLVSSYFEPDWLEALVLAFALSLAFNTVPLMGGFFISLSFGTVLNLAIISILLLSALMYLLDRFGIRGGKIVYRPIDSQIASLALFAGAVVYVVAKFGTIMIAVGDEKVYLARIVRILEVPALSSTSIEPFKGGGVHPGYAFPLWQMILAAISKLSGVSPTLVWFYLNPLLALFALLSLYFFVRALFKNRVLATFVVVFYTLPSFFVGNHVFKVLPGLNLHGDNVFESLRLMGHPVKLSMLVLYFLIGGFFVTFIRIKKFSFSLLSALSLLMLVQAFVHVSHLFYFALILISFSIFFTIFNHQNSSVVKRSLLIIGILIIIGFTYYQVVYDEAGLHGDNPFLGAKRYLDEGRLMEFAGGYVPSPEEFVNTLPLLLVSVMFIPMVKRDIGMAFLFANILSVFFIVTNPWVYSGMAGVLTFTQMDRFLSNVWLNWLLSAIFVYFLLAYFVYERDRIMEKRGRVLKAMTFYIALILITGYLAASWILITAAGSLNGINGIFLGELTLLILLAALFLTSFRFSPDTALFERIFKTRPGYSLVILFLGCFLFFSYLTADISAIESEYKKAEPFPTEPTRIQGNGEYVSPAFIKAVRKKIPADKVVIADPRTSQVLASFVPRYVVTYVGGHQSMAEVGEDVWGRMDMVNEFFRPDTSIKARRKIIEKYDVDYVIVNKPVFKRYSLQTRDLLPEQKLLYMDEQFKIYRIMR